MVKNTKGGSSHKKMGRKFQSASGGAASRQLREISDPDEMYAAVIKMLGNGMCEVMCNDGKQRLCIIRNKFRGRGKRDNTVAIGVWVMVGIRSWEIASKDKLEKCDLLEVYNEGEKIKLKKMSGVELSKLAPDLHQHGGGATNDDDMLVFSNVDHSATEDIMQEMAEDSMDINAIKNIVVADDGEMVSIDDI
jgi:initiation factor 1A